MGEKKKKKKIQDYSCAEQPASQKSSGRAAVPDNCLGVDKHKNISKGLE